MLCGASSTTRPYERSASPRCASESLTGEGDTVPEAVAVPDLPADAMVADLGSEFWSSRGCSLIYLFSSHCCLPTRP